MGVAVGDLGVHTGPLHDQRARLAGTWRNELGSELTLAEEGGILAGAYRSAVGRTLAPQPLTGTSVRRPDGSAVVGFVVSWAATHSLATWAGTYQPLTDRIVATWLLEAGAAECTAWRATHIGNDVFVRSSRS